MTGFQRYHFETGVCRPPSEGGSDSLLVRLCVQLRLVCSAGVSPARVRIRNSVAWMADRRETKYLKPIDKAIL